jgi:hypothetical protein
MALRLDPAPYVWNGRSASDFDPDCDGEGWSVTFAPRPGYDQDEAAYS